MCPLKTKNYRLSTKKGYTLLELLLYLAIFSVIITAVVYFAWNVVYGGQKSSNLNEVSYSARYTAERIKYEIRNSSGITLGSSYFGVNLATTPGSKLTLTSADVSRNPIVIDISSGTLRATVGANPVANLTPTNISVTNLVFTNNSSGDSKTKNISFALTLESNVVSPGQIKQSIILESAAEIRGN